MSSIIGTLPVTHAVDPSGSFTMNVPLQLPQSRFKPDLSLAYHSAAVEPSLLGRGWSLLGASAIERVPATAAQDGFRGTVKYDANDRFALDGQRLVKIGTKNEYRFEVEQWSRIFALGTDPANPTSWEQHLPDGTIRRFGNTNDSNIKALTGKASPPTRVWAISESIDSFLNNLTFTYINDSTTTGAYRLDKIQYGGNSTPGGTIQHQRKVYFEYDDRTDPITVYFGGYKILHSKRIKHVTTSYTQTNKEHNVLRYVLFYDEAPVTKLNYLSKVELKDLLNNVSMAPLSFGWTGSIPAKVFDDTKRIATITDIPKGSLGQIIPLDVNGSGCNDMVVTWNKQNTLALNVYLSDLTGKISSTPAPGSGSTGLDFSDKSFIFPLDISGDGLTDILHIRVDDAKSVYQLTGLLSKPDRSKPKEVKFEKQQTVEFKPAVMGGRFHTGDFAGDSRVGLVYVFEDKTSHTVKFIQFTSDGTKMVAKTVQQGPSVKEGDFEKMRAIVGDLDGNGADDLFLVYPRADATPKSWNIAFLESKSGALTYRSDNPFDEVAKKVAFVEDNTVLPFNADSDSKAGLLFVSKSSTGKLQFQLLRSTGTTLLADSSPTVTAVDYGGNVTVTRITSTNTLDVVNVTDSSTGPKLRVFRFDSTKFSEVPNTTQPSNVPKESLIRWADLRGIGRSDCVLNTMDATTGSVTVNSMLCSGLNLSASQWQPLDCIHKYSQPLGYLYQVSYAPLSDPTAYKSSDSVVKALVNSLADNSASSGVLTGSKSGAQNMSTERAQLVSFPRFVVHRTNARLGTREINPLLYTYSNARVDFGGRGWLGFETINKTDGSLGITETSSYFQQFPLVSTVSKLETKGISPARMLKVYEYPWTSIDVNDKKNKALQLPKLKESYYEESTDPAYDVEVQFTYDAYGNATKTQISTPHDLFTFLSIESTFQKPTDNPSTTSRWIVGNKLTEETKLKTTSLGQIKNEYLANTNQRTKTSNWVEGSNWSTTTYKYDSVGNLTNIEGPDKRQRYEYDDTLSFPKMTMTFTDVNKFFIELAEYEGILNLVLGLPSSIMRSNNLFNSFKYDTLGREIEKSQGTDKNAMKVMEKVVFTAQDAKLVETRSISNGLSTQGWRQTITVFDEGGRPVTVKESRPDDLSKFICRTTEYDDAGRVAARSRPYLEGQQFVKATYEYDVFSRLLKAQYPPAKSGGPAVTRKLTYSYQKGTTNRAVTMDELTDGTIKRRVIREMVHLPNADSPGGGSFVKSCVVLQHDELNQQIKTEFDGLTRPITITDPNGVKLTLTYDGLSRETSRKITTGTGTSAKTVSHFTATFDDAQRQTTLRNVLTSNTVVSNRDYYGRLTKKVTKEETVDFTYDKEFLSKAASSKNFSQGYQYDAFGNLTNSTLTVDKRDFKSTFTWTQMGQLLTATNPDGSSLKCTLLTDGVTPQSLTLANSSKQDKASAAFSSFDNAYARPLTCRLGSGSTELTSQSTIANDGLVTSNVVTKGTTKLLNQVWDFDAFKQVSQYSLTKAATTTEKYKYDAASHLTEVTSQGGFWGKADFSYDSSGNISKHNNLSYINDGWQLTTIKNPDQTVAYTFQYSSDGNRTSKNDASGKVLDTMTYDSEGRLVKLNNTTFEYDYTGRMVKSTTVEGTTTKTTIYINDEYELDIIKIETDTGPVTQESHTSYLVHENRLGSLSTTNTRQEVRYYHYDNLGSVVAASADGAMSAYYEYDAFGKVNVTGFDISRYKYSGKQMFGSLYYFGSRFYDPDVGRFLTLDNYPLDLDNLSPSKFNMYTFSQNDPINNIDPDGNDSMRWWHW
ncbi:hypothetical protein AMATHDRAFT_150088 [Amanita thiersii Skay4041]|uniref:Insecticide toxin TcdB middle/N-terminal domain-containing protein n=1 Tax=Amanita thiersii Skay4041 TaxID=703135 RepID=A0A2A9NKW5_9AGAR|nr:hypothetical protein AMATHDRAFT_150088 [Amanita thiersii Skay4041]